MADEQKKEDPPFTGGSVVVRMKTADHAEFVELLQLTSNEHMDGAETKRFREIVKTYFPRG